jgi:hypothetical protein
VQRTPTFVAAMQQKVSQVQRTATFVCSFIITVKNISVRCTSLQAVCYGDDIFLKDATFL